MAVSDAVIEPPLVNGQCIVVPAGTQLVYPMPEEEARLQAERDRQIEALIVFVSGLGSVLVGVLYATGYHKTGGLLSIMGGTIAAVAGAARILGDR